MEFFFPRIEKEDSALVQMAPYISRSYREYTLFTIPPPWSPSHLVYSDQSFIKRSRRNPKLRRIISIKLTNFES